MMRHIEICCCIAKHFVTSLSLPLRKSLFDKTTSARKRDPLITCDNRYSRNLYIYIRFVVNDLLNTVQFSRQRIRSLSASALPLLYYDLQMHIISDCSYEINELVSSL